MIRCLVLHLMFLAVFANGVEISVNTIIEKSDKNEWMVTFKTNAPVDILIFKYSPDASRIIRWKPSDENFAITFEDNTEFVSRKNFASFKQVSFYLTPTYTNLPKDYAPFSPFSDGSMLVHSGRFFVCPNACSKVLNSWKMTLIAAETDHIIVDGKEFRGKASWVDEDKGQKVYVGSSLPNENEHVYALIDGKLPTVLYQALEQQIPAMMTFFATKLGSLDSKPTLFASYSETSDGSYGNQGGTLQNQVFMHWFGKEAIGGLNEYQVSWFFAHEVAHIYQKDAKNILAINDQWIHEGGAEYMAYELLDSLAGEYRKYANNRLKNSHQSCSKSTDTSTFGALVSAGNYDILYKCGLVFWTTLANDKKLKESNLTVFDIWTSFNSAVEKGRLANAKTFLVTLKPLVSEATYRTIENIQTFTALNNPLKLP